MNPPFFGTRLLDSISIEDLLPLIDLEALFASRWQFKGGANPDEWDEIKQKTAVPALERILLFCRAHSVIEPRILYGYFKCHREESALIVEGELKSFRFDFPRERAYPNRSVADFFPEGVIAMELSTIGGGAGREGAKLFAKNSYSDAFFLKGFAAEATEALSEFASRRIADELGAPGGKSVRFSPGYPAFPSLFDQRKIAALLKFTQAGVSLTKTCHLVPEHSTTAIVSVFPKAMHFHP